MTEIDKTSVKRYMGAIHHKQEQEYWENQRKGLAALKGA